MAKKTLHARILASSRKTLFGVIICTVLLLLGFVIHQMEWDSSNFYWFVLAFPFWVLMFYFWILISLFLTVALPLISAFMVLFGLGYTMAAIVTPQPILRRIGTFFVALLAVGLGAGGVYWWVYCFMAPIIAADHH